jgi:hypothetical protein
MPKKITTIVEDYVGHHYSATESERGSLVITRWADFHTMKLAAGQATTAITNGLMEMDARTDVDAFLSRLDGRYEAPEKSLRLPVRRAS